MISSTSREETGLDGNYYASIISISPWILEHALGHGGTQLYSQIVRRSAQTGFSEALSSKLKEKTNTGGRKRVKDREGKSREREKEGGKEKYDRVMICLF